METSIYSNSTIRQGTPESVGISPLHIARYLQRLREMEYDLHSLQICRNNQVVFAAAASPYTLESPHRLLSAAKAIIGAAVLFAVDEGALSLDAPVVKYFSDEVPEHPDERMKNMTVYHLLTMQTGQDTDEAFLHFLEHPDEDLCRSFFHTAMTCDPGEHFFYNNSVPHLLFTLTERATGKEFASYVREKLGGPLGMEITAQYNSRHIYDPVTTVVTANGFLKLALWFLKQGEWNHRQLIDPALIRMACAQQVWTGNEKPGYQNGAGYCMQLWRNAFGGCRMDGGGGQIALILPEADMAVTIMGNESRGDQAIQLFYEEIYSKMSGKPLREQAAEREALEEETRRMSRAPRGVLAHGKAERQLAEKEWQFAPNQWGLMGMQFEFQEKETWVQVRTEQGVNSYQIGLDGQMPESSIPFLLEPDLSIQNRIYGPDPRKCHLSGGWSDERTFVIVSKSTASMGEYQFRCVAGADGLELYLPNGISAGMKPEAGWTCLHAV